MTNSDKNLGESFFDYATKTAQKSSPKAELSSCLDGQLKASLVEIAKEYGLEKPSSLKKQELVSETEKAILKNLSKTILENEKDLAKLRELFKESSSVPLSKLSGASANIIKKGLIFSYNKDNEVYLIMPDEIKTQLQKSEANYNKDNFKKFVSGLISLYGAFSLNSAIALYNSETGESVNAEAAEKDVKALKTISTKKGFILDKAFGKAEKKAVDAMIEKLKEGSFYKASFDSIMAHSDDSYYDETAELTHLVKFASEYVTGNKVAAEKIVSEIVSRHKRCTGYSIEKYTDVFHENGYGFRNVGTESKVVTLLVEALGTVRMWVYCGYTAIEMKKLALSEMSKKKAINAKIPFISKKIGRNDPCPCGSGLKYKKCCGKNL